jgi:neutral ceramidase
MLGWAEDWNVANSYYTRLFARAFVLETPERSGKVAWVSAEVGFITVGIFQAVVDRLMEQYPERGFRHDNVLLCANHTHSAPGGITYHILYNMTTPGFCPSVFLTYVEGIVEAIIHADDTKAAGKVEFVVGEIGYQEKVAFNRAPDAYNRNPEVKPSDRVNWGNRHYATDRRMMQLVLSTLEGLPIGVINWFPVHCTSIHDDKTTSHSDNKGIAALLLEEAAQKEGHRGFIAAFAQTATGDITPNFMKHRGNWRMSGPTPDDYENARFNGEIQYKKAHELWEKAGTHGVELGATFDSVFTYIDMSGVAVSPEYCLGLKNQRTGPAIHGISFLGGTAEGGGLPDLVIYLLDKYIRLRGGTDREVHGNKAFGIESVGPAFFSHKHFVSILKRLPPWLHPTVRNAKRFLTHEQSGAFTMIPHVVPIQLMMIGELAILALPFEPSHMTGKRLEKQVITQLGSKGVKHVVISGYSNGYVGYATTYEEYELQGYEAGHTVFGKWTLAALQTITEQLAVELLKPVEERRPVSTVLPPVFKEADLSWRLFEQDPLASRSDFLNGIRFKESIGSQLVR